VRIELPAPIKPDWALLRAIARIGKNVPNALSDLLNPLTYELKSRSMNAGTACARAVVEIN
jgi:hypothetical protein